MLIQIDTREKAKAISKIIKTFDDLEIRYISSKLYVGDYMSYDNPYVIIDRKQNLGELAGNICGKQHKRFSTELQNAKAAGIKIIVLVEHGNNIHNLEDVKTWSSPHTKVKGETLAKAMKTMQENKEKYDVEFRFCSKEETGEQIIKILLDEKTKNNL